MAVTLTSVGREAEPSFHRPGSSIITRIARGCIALRRLVASVVPQHRLEHLLRLGVELVTLAKAETAIPAQKGVVVAWSTKPFGLFVEVHRPTNPLVSHRFAPWPAL